MASAKLVDELSCNNYAGVISLTNTTSPFDATGLGEQGSLCPPLANVKGLKMRQENKNNSYFGSLFPVGLNINPCKAGCYTVIASDLDGDMLVQNGCHDGSLDFQTECMCLPNQGYLCWDLCTDSNCNGQVELHTEMIGKCEMNIEIEGEEETDKENNAVTNLLCTLFLLSSLY